MSDVTANIISRPSPSLWHQYRASMTLSALNLTAAAIVTALVLLALGESPIEAWGHLMRGSFGSAEGFGYMLAYATNFILTGLAVSVAYHAGLFNIGGEGQVLAGGVGMTLGIFLFGESAPMLGIVAGLLGGALFGGLWALLPALMQAYRGSHIVITTIMFNYIAAGILAYLLTGPLKRPDSAIPESADYPDGVGMMPLTHLFEFLGLNVDMGPVNLSLVVAFCIASGVWFLLWRTALGYRIRVVGANPEAARYAGISVPKITVIAMIIAGGCAGLMGMNELMGEQSRLINNFSNGAGFVGIAVAFMGRNHPLGIVLAALLFGFLAQGGVELSFEMENVTQYLVVVIQGVVILFAGALENLFKKPVDRLFDKTVGG